MKARVAPHGSQGFIKGRQDHKPRVQTVFLAFYGSRRQVGGREILSLVREAAAQAIVEPAGGERTLGSAPSV